MKKMLGVDWGTSSLRVYLIAEGGEVLDEKSSDLGLKKAKGHGFERSLRDTAQGLLEGVEVVMMSGMVGAREGWAEASYLDCPCNAGDLAKNMTHVPVEGLDAMIAPGVKDMQKDFPDVIRGEETQVFGALAQGGKDGLYVLPGTHSKWVTVKDGSITGFSTYMTGDVYQAIRSHTVFGMEAGDATELQKEQFAEGVRLGAGSQSGGNLLSSMFSVRTLRLFGNMDAKETGSYLSGMLIGAEMADGSRQRQDDGELILIGDRELTEKYEMAARQLGIKTALAQGNPVVSGLCLYGALLKDGQSD